MRPLPLLLLLALLLSLALPCLAATPAVPEDEDDPFAGDEAAATVADPLEPVNRGLFWVNDKLYFYLFKPVARVWRVVPEPARTSVDNAFDNLAAPGRFLNNVLQLKFARAGGELGRFLVNSTLGVLGLFDPADAWLDLKPHNEDTGQTFGHYGLGHGVYLVLPLFGPSSLRDGVGRVGDAVLHPLTWVDLTLLERAGIRSFDAVNTLSLDKDTYEAIVEQSVDPYLTLRDAYIQRRAGQVRE